MEYLKVICFLTILNLALITAEVQQQYEYYNDMPYVSKRSFIQFAAMIKCTTGRSGLAYNGYGCWCGKGGRGIPVDGTDRCCQVHDRCYDRIIARKICRFSWQVYIETYTRLNCNRCYSPRNNHCKRAICMCDSAAARCFKRNAFHRQYVNYNKRKC